MLHGAPVQCVWSPNAGVHEAVKVKLNLQWRSQNTGDARYWALPPRIGASTSRTGPREATWAAGNRDGAAGAIRAHRSTDVPSQSLRILHFELQYLFGTVVSLWFSLCLLSTHSSTGMEMFTACHSTLGVYSLFSCFYRGPQLTDCAESQKRLLLLNGARTFKVGLNVLCTVR